MSALVSYFTNNPNFSTLKQMQENFFNLAKLFVAISRGMWYYNRRGRESNKALQEKGKNIVNQNKIDRRRNYVIMLDTETANTFRDENGKLETHSALVYDIGWCIMDTKGNVYEEYSFLVREIFIESPDLMRSAYYGYKRAGYAQDVRDGKRKIANWLAIRKLFQECCERYDVTAVVAHNARFDCQSLRSTTRIITGSCCRNFVPYDIDWWDTLKMARDVILKMPTYKRFAEENDLLTNNGRLSASAENLYRFITNDPSYKECHTGLEDVQIEREIFKTCMRQHKPMRKKLWEN